MDRNERHRVWWFHLRPQLFFVWGGLLGLVISWIRRTGDPYETRLLVICIGGAFGMIGFLANFWDLRRNRAPPDPP